MALTRPKYSSIEDTDYKASCRVVTTTNITLAGGAPSVHDEINLAAGDRVLVTGQSSPTQNGIYVVQTLGTGSNGTWIRSKDANTDAKVTAGFNTYIEEGTYAAQQWRLATANPITLGVTELTFIAPSGGTVGGSNTNIQYNASGAMAGATNFRYWAANGNVTIGSTTASADVNTGALVVKGGVGVGGSLYINNTGDISANIGAYQQYANANLSALTVGVTSLVTNANTNTAAYLASGNITSNVQLSANVTIGNLQTSGKIQINDDTNATPYVMGSGAFHVVGGMSIGKDFWVGGNLYVANVISQSSTILEVNEPLVYLDASDFPYNYDIGVFSDFTGGSANIYQYTGAVRSYQTNEWVFFSNLTTAPGSGIVSITSSGILYDPIKAGNIVAANTTPSTSKTTGALIVGGGAGIAGNVYANRVYSTEGLYWAGNGNVMSTGGGSGGSFTTSNTAPPGPALGDEWYSPQAHILYKYINDGTSSLWLDLTSPLYNANTEAIANTIALRDSGGNLTAINFIGIASSAKYADLAEKYVADTSYRPGTVVVFGGDQEITITNVDHDTRVAGVISTNPAYLMNSESPGLPVALTGRVPCYVLGPVDKGDILVTSQFAGVAQRMIKDRFQPGSVIGKSLGHIGHSEIVVIEIVVGRF